MLQKTFVATLILVLLVPGALAVLEVQSDQDATFDCEAMIVEEKSYIAKSSEIDVGLWCSETANVLLYDCNDLFCEDKTYLTFASKVDGSLATVTGFEVGTKYNYECYECPVAPTLTLEYDSLTIQETETFEVMASCIDSKGRVGSVEFNGWFKTNRKITGYDDAGEYSARITCGDQNGMTTTEELIVTVEDVNRPPTVHAVLKK
tara:strand:- start:951 stop:1565 length:615 start_codon:yes stop_codon:yes gene_type:complete